MVEDRKSALLTQLDRHGGVMSLWKLKEAMREHEPSVTKAQLGDVVRQLSESHEIMEFPTKMILPDYRFWVVVMRLHGRSIRSIPYPNEVCEYIAEVASTLPLPTVSHKGMMQRLDSRCNGSLTNEWRHRIAFSFQIRAGG